MSAAVHRILAVFLINALLFPLTPQTARADTGMSSTASDAYAAPDVNPSTFSASANTTAAAAKNAPEIPVSSQGNFQTSVPIVVPPGRHGMQPSLALTYDSGPRKKPFQRARGGRWVSARSAVP